MRILRLIPLAVVAIACARVNQPPAGQSDEAAIRETTLALIHRLDHRRWAEMPALFTEQVETDYTSLFGGQPQRQSAEALVNGWRSVLTPLNATQHMLGPIEVSISGDSATARSHVRGYHVADHAPGGREWMVAGHYVWGLVRSEKRWRIRSLRLETFYQTGNRALLQEAGQRSPPAPKE